MNTTRLYAVSLGICLLAALAEGAAPVIENLKVNSVASGQAISMVATVKDTDGDLDYVRFEVLPPGDTGWQTLGSVEVNGSADSAVYEWLSTAPGLYRVRATVHDLGGAAVLEKSLEVFTGQMTVPPQTIASGDGKMITSPGELLTAENPAGLSVVVQNDGRFVLWSGGRVVLKPGFKSEAGSFFWAAVDHDGDGYSDVEEAQDTDGDGIFDAWEVDHGMNMLSSNDALLDFDNDGITNIQEFLNGTNPRGDSGGGGGGILPPGFQLVIQLPSISGANYYGVHTVQGTFSAVPGP